MLTAAWVGLPLGASTPYAATASAAEGEPPPSRTLSHPPTVGDTVGGVLFPAATGAGPPSAVIVVGEWWGVDSHTLQCLRGERA